MGGLFWNALAAPHEEEICRDQGHRMQFAVESVVNILQFSPFSIKTRGETRIFSSLNSIGGYGYIINIPPVTTMRTASQSRKILRRMHSTLTFKFLYLKRLWRLQLSVYYSQSKQIKLNNKNIKISLQ